MRHHVLAVLLGVALWPGMAAAGNLLASKENFFQPHLGAPVPPGLAFVDDAGKKVKLGDYFGERPVILVLAYYECPMLCKLVLKDLVDGLKRAPLTAGDDFEVVVVSFDSREKPDLAARHKAAYVEAYESARPPAGKTERASGKGWHFLTGEQPEIDALTEAVGFRAVWDDEKKQFAHARGILILTPKGVVARYLLEGVYPPRTLHLALVEASEGQVGKPMDRILLMCFNYDPSTGKYSLAVLRLVRIAGVLTMLGIAAFWLAAWRRGRRLAPAGDGAIQIDRGGATGG